MNEPPDHTAELSAANLLSSGGMIVAEVLAQQFGVLADGRVGIGEDDALLGEVLLQRAVNHFALELRLHAGEEFLFGFGNTQLIERVFDLLGHVVPGLALVIGRLQVVVDVLEVDIDARRPIWALASIRRFQRCGGGKSRIQAGSPFISEICATISAYSGPFVP